MLNRKIKTLFVQNWNDKLDLCAIPFEVPEFSCSTQSPYFKTIKTNILNLLFASAWRVAFNWARYRNLPAYLHTFIKVPLSSGKYPIMEVIGVARAYPSK